MMMTDARYFELPAAPPAAGAPPDVVEGQCPRCGERDGSHAADCRHWTCDHCGHDQEAHRDGLASRLERDGHFHSCRAAQAHGYLSRLLTHCAPQCQPLPDLMGLCSQIDNLIAGLRAAPPAVAGGDAPEIQVGDLVRIGLSVVWGHRRDWRVVERDGRKLRVRRIWSTGHGEWTSVSNVDEVERNGVVIWRRRQEGQ